MPKQLENLSNYNQEEKELIFKQNNQIHNMLLQYFIHKEFIEPKMRLDNLQDIGIQCQMDRDV